MKVYNVLFISTYENEGIESCIATFATHKDARRCLKQAVEEEIRDFGYSKSKLKHLFHRVDSDSFCFYHDYANSNPRFSGKIYENTVNEASETNA